jgi:hypothetical protein
LAFAGPLIAFGAAAFACGDIVNFYHQINSSPSAADGDADETKGERT